ncbi:hypothetical protein AAFF_G00049540 [Aldrovandia affinis]|uniref:Ewing's tumor-associated antigen 1 n=1 Tax=Aldrovandia affinis TaxID=143900 RepID=A0AAD7S189_9TELE|nr:hypothetical protein AAFF_G00049540 [Aldrovandia affinis]
MNERRKHCDLSSRTGSEDDERVRVSKLSQNKSKNNRLSRNLRQTQKSPSFDQSPICHRDVKTRKRHTRIRTNALNQCDSPSNDSDLQQDIIWDPTSPTPVYNGKGVKKSINMRVVDISEIANRIAPKNERPVVPESSLLQWIGDAVPCTPEVRQPRIRKKSTRLNDVEDLMKLAKQFDFNMYQQDKEQVKESKEESANQDVDGLDSQGNNLPPSPNDVPTTSKGAAFQIPDSGEQMLTGRKPLDQEMEDDLDALFDGPTQHISRRLSQCSSTYSQEGRGPPVTASSEDALPEKGSDLGPSNPSAVSSAPVNKPEGMPKAPVSNRLADDDWDNDDLLNDSLVIEMTQNPELFVSPKHCSTQIRPSQKQNDFDNKPSGRNGAPGRLPQGSCGNGSGSLYQGKNSKNKNRSTFKLETNPNFHVNETLSGGEKSSRHGLGSSKPETQGGPQNREKSLFQPDRPVSLEPSHQSNQKTQPVPNGERENQALRPVLQQSSSAPSSSRTTGPVQAGNQVSAVRGAKSVESEREEEKRKKNAGVAKDQPVDTTVADDDLDAIFESDSLWDDGDDDDLLCQVCDDVEKLSQSQDPSEAATSPEQDGPKSTPSSAAVKATAAHSARHGKRRSRASARGNAAAPQVSVALKPAAQTSGSIVRNDADSAANGAQSSVSWQQGTSGKGVYKFTQLKKSSLMAGANSGATPGPSNAENATWARNTTSSNHNSFKRHLSDPMALTNKVFVPSQGTVKCSEAEIERKKQEALARRRLRVQTSQKHGGPT